ncbi:hypothetical protein Daus18300_008200 [Diaporthe australafricana]|uniref:2EXR domain-containing protein n=1 Tax=Diaporthe australafricana TaxID=127596 RepID=A0ABR3WJA7_9PEZI
MANQSRYSLRNTKSRRARAINAGSIVDSDPQHAPSDGIGTQPGQLSLPDPATTFPQFRALPVELQDMIWEEAYDALRVSPEFVSFRVNLYQKYLQWDHDIFCFTPDSQTAQATRAHRGLLGACRQTRHKALQCLTILTLFRLDPSTGRATEYRVPFNGENTSLYVHVNFKSWFGFQRKMNLSRAEIRGFAIAKHVRRLTFVVDHIEKFEAEYMPSELSQLTHKFHNAVHIGSIKQNLLGLKEMLGEHDSPLFSHFSTSRRR